MAFAKTTFGSYLRFLMNLLFVATVIVFQRSSNTAKSTFGGKDDPVLDAKVRTLQFYDWETNVLGPGGRPVLTTAPCSHQALEAPAATPPWLLIVALPAVELA